MRPNLRTEFVVLPVDQNFQVLLTGQQFRQRQNFGSTKSGLLDFERHQWAGWPASEVAQSALQSDPET
jgi:hypothetical protein